MEKRDEMGEKGWRWRRLAGGLWEGHVTQIGPPPVLICGLHDLMKKNFILLHYIHMATSASTPTMSAKEHAQALLAQLPVVQAQAKCKE